MAQYWMNDVGDENQWYSQSNNENLGMQQQDQQLNWAQYDYNQTPQHGPPTQNYSSTYHSQQPPTGNYYDGHMFMPSAGSSAAVDDFENEPPLLEELGINFSHIKEKTLAVLNPFGSATPDVIAGQDLAGPLVFCLLFGAALLLHGKVHFGNIYGIGLLSCIGVYALLNLMSTDKSISFTCTASVLGYCLLPMAILSMIAAVFSFQGLIGYLMSAGAVFWCSSSSSKLFVTMLSMDGQRLLVAYPCALLYCVFALLAIF